MGIIATFRNAVRWAGIDLKNGATAQVVALVDAEGVGQSGTEGAAHSYPVARILGSLSVSIGAASAQSSALSGRTVRLCATVDAHIAIGADPTATGTSTLLPAGTVEYFQIEDGWKVAVVQASGAGALSISTVRI